MPSLEEMKRIAEEQESLKAEITTIGPPYGVYKNADVLALMKVVEAVKAFLPELEHSEGYICTHTENKLRDALEDLENG